MVISSEIFTGDFRTLSIYEQSLLLYLTIRTNQKTGQCNPSQKTIMNDMTVNEKATNNTTARAA
jgi:hypothetical protein